MQIYIQHNYNIYTAVHQCIIKHILYLLDVHGMVVFTYKLHNE